MVGCLVRRRRVFFFFFFLLRFLLQIFFPPLVFFFSFPHAQASTPASSTRSCPTSSSPSRSSPWRSLAGPQSTPSGWPSSTTAKRYFFKNFFPPTFSYVVLLRFSRSLSCSTSLLSFSFASTTPKKMNKKRTIHHQNDRSRRSTRPTS